MGRRINVVVVGAGVGGLACAIELASSGFSVRLLERSGFPGGKARVLRVGGSELDAGPTVLTMVWVFDELFAAAGASFRSAVQIERASILARHFWSDGTQLDLHASRAESADAIAKLFGASEGRAYLAFCEDVERIYNIAEGPFLRSQRMTIKSIAKKFGALGFASLARLDSHRSMWRALEERFREPKLRQLFGRYATYCGSSPFEAPGTLNLVAHVEAQGVYRARGGMHALVAALEGLARSAGVEIAYHSPVERFVVSGNRVIGVVVQGSEIAADAVIFNGDVSALGDGLLGAPARRSAPSTPLAGRSLSAISWLMVGRARGAPLLHHNVFFSNDYAGEFDALFKRHRLAERPTVYVCAQDRGDRVEEKAEERLLVLTNAPATGDDLASFRQSDLARYDETVFDCLKANGLLLEPTHLVRQTPVDFHALFPGTGGALYGPRSKGARSVLAREGAASGMPGLYLAGGSVHPGPGVPMSALSGRLAAARIREDLQPELTRGRAARA